MTASRRTLRSLAEFEAVWQALALRDDASALTYGALDALMDRVGAALQRDGLAAGDTIAICAEATVWICGLSALLPRRTAEKLPQ